MSTKDDINKHDELIRAEFGLHGITTAKINEYVATPEVITSELNRLVALTDAIVVKMCGTDHSNKADLAVYTHAGEVIGKRWRTLYQQRSEDYLAGLAAGRAETKSD